MLPSDWEGTMVTDRGHSYDAWQLAGVKQHKGSFHVLGSVEQVLEDKRGAARWFGLELKGLTHLGPGRLRRNRAPSCGSAAMPHPARDKVLRFPQLPDRGDET